MVEHIPSTYIEVDQMVGSRLSAQPGVRDMCDTLDALPCSDLVTVLTMMSKGRAEVVTPQEVQRGNRFHEPSDVSPRTFHKIESLIFNTQPDLEFVELSPLQPFGTNTALAGISEKNVVAALRGSEVNADATTALFRVSLDRFLGCGGEDKTTVAANVRTVRAQQYQKGSKLLPHFKVFAEVTVGKQGRQYGRAELASLAGHLATEVDTLDAVAASDFSKLARLSISASNLLFSRQLVERGELDVAGARTATRLLGQVSLVEGAKTPESIPLATPNLGEQLREMGFTKGVRVAELFQGILAEDHPALLSRIKLDLRRVAGIGYYRHMCYKIIGFDDNDDPVPLVDGGTTNWAERVTNNKQLYTVTSGLGTELLARHLMKD